MNRLLKYSILLTVCFMVMASPTCEDEISLVENRQIHLNRLKTVSDDFTSESLSGKNLEAFEFKAVEKLMDYADYMEIIYSEDFAGSFREQARQNITGLFNNSENADAALSIENISGAYNAYQVLIDSVEIMTPLNRDADAGYTGNMRYNERIFGITLSDTIILYQTYKTIEIILQMEYKDFGENSLLVWEVLLGEIKPAN